MELAYYARFIKRQFALIVGAAVVVAVIAGVVTALQKDHAEANGSILLRIKDSRQLSAYDYDQFYVVQATDQYASNVVSWLNSAQVRADIRRDAGVNPGVGQIVGKKNGGTIELTITAPQTDQAMNVAKATDALVVGRTTELSPGPNRSSFQAVPLPVTTETVKPNPVRSTGVGFAAGLILGLVLALLAEATRPAGRKR